MNMHVHCIKCHQSWVWDSPSPATKPPKLCPTCVMAVINPQPLPKSKRVNKEEYALKLAEVAALRSEDIHCRVGAVAMTREGRIIATAYNGLSVGLQSTEKFWSDREARRMYVIHAEANLCSLFKRGEVHTVACTLSPCVACTKQLIAHGVQRIIYREPYEREFKDAIAVAHFHSLTFTRVEQPPLTVDV